MLDSEKLRADLGALAHELRVLKNELSRTWTRPMADEQRRLVRLRWRATELCVLRAWTRGKRHVSRADVDDVWHAKIAERVAKDYVKTDVVEEGAAR